MARRKCTDTVTLPLGGKHTSARAGTGWRGALRESLPWCIAGVFCGGIYLVMEVATKI